VMWRVLAIILLLGCWGLSLEVVYQDGVIRQQQAVVDVLMRVQSPQIIIPSAPPDADIPDADSPARHQSLTKNFQ
jgi:hypothetical protein